MMRRPTQFSPARQRVLRRGTTLIEVLAGLIILGTLLVSVSIARARFLNQWAQANVQLRAAKAADTLLSTWLSGSPESVPIQSQGPLAAMPGFIWHTHVLPNSQEQTLSAIIVRLQIVQDRSQPTSVPQLGVHGQSILSIDFLLHQAAPQTNISRQQ